jgi:hypothetical protein
MTPDDIDRFAARVMTAVYVADVQRAKDANR